MTGDLIRITVPAKPEYVITIRMAIASVAARLDYDVDTIEDIKSGAAEVCILFLNATSKPEYFDITISTEKEFSITIKGIGDGLLDIVPVNEEVNVLAKCLIEEFYDQSKFDYEGDRLKSVTISKHLAA